MSNNKRPHVHSEFHKKLKLTAVEMGITVKELTRRMSREDNFIDCWDIVKPKKVKKDEKKFKFL